MAVSVALAAYIIAVDGENIECPEHLTDAFAINDAIARNQLYLIDEDRWDAADQALAVYAIDCCALLADENSLPIELFLHDKCRIVNQACNVVFLDWVEQLWQDSGYLLFLVSVLIGRAVFSGCVSLRGFLPDQLVVDDPRWPRPNVPGGLRRKLFHC